MDIPRKKQTEERTAACLNPMAVCYVDVADKLVVVCIECPQIGDSIRSLALRPISHYSVVAQVLIAFSLRFLPPFYVSSSDSSLVSLPHTISH